jgi:hypothetical protein
LRATCGKALRAESGIRADKPITGGLIRIALITNALTLSRLTVIRNASTCVAAGFAITTVGFGITFVGLLIHAGVVITADSVSVAVAVFRTGDAAVFAIIRLETDITIFTIFI